jgi:hypothetical protein
MLKACLVLIHFHLEEILIIRAEECSIAASAKQKIILA